MERVSKWVTAAIKRRRKKHIEIILFLCKIHFIRKHFCMTGYVLWSGWVGMGGWMDEYVRCSCIYVCFFIGFYVNTECVYYTTWGMWVFEILHKCVYMDVASCFACLTLPRCNNTILFSKHPNRNAQKKRLKSTYILFQTSISLSPFALSFSSLSGYPTLVLLPFIHFTFIIRIKHIRFIWRVH